MSDIQLQKVVKSCQAPIDFFLHGKCGEEVYGLKEQILAISVCNVGFSFAVGSQCFNPSMTDQRRVTNINRHVNSYRHD